MSARVISVGDAGQMIRAARPASSELSKGEEIVRMDTRTVRLVCLAERAGEPTTEVCRT